MYLKALSIAGFKSFAQPVQLELGPGITAIVGPNGSGKSNIVDAVRWVLGEQSARAIRGTRSEDVIFSGSAMRHAQGMAEVSLLLDNGDGRVALELAEVAIARRLYRSGDTEYLLNRRRARLRDVLDVAGQAGLGPDSYCVVGQGAIEQLVLQRPQERRGLIADAADVRRHEARLAEIESSLAETQQNALRIAAVVAELRPQLERVRRQAERADRHHRVRDEADRLARAWFSRVWPDARRTLARLERERLELQAAIAERRAGVVEADGARDAAQAALRALRSQRSVVEHQLTEERSRRESMRIEAAGMAERRLVHSQRIERLRAELAGLDARMAEASAAVEKSRAVLEEELATLEAATDSEQGVETAAAEAAMQQARRLLRDAEREADERRRRIEDLERRALRRQADSDAARAAIEAWESRRGEIQRRLDDLASAQQTIEQETVSLRGELEGADREVASARTTATERRKAHQTAEEARTAARRDADRLAGEETGIQRMQRQAAPSGQDGAGSLLVDLVPVVERYERAVAAALGSAARYGVVDVGDTAWNVDQAPGGQTILVPKHGTANDAAVEAFWQEVAAILSGPDSAPYVPASTVLRDGASHDLATRYLSRTLIVGSRNDAKAVAHRLFEAGRHLSFQVASLDGHCFRGNGEHVLAPEPSVQQGIELRARLAELAAQAQGAREALARAEAAVEATHADAEEATTRLRAAEDARRAVATRLARGEEQRRINHAAQQREQTEAARLDRTRPQPPANSGQAEDDGLIDEARAAYDAARQLVRSRGEDVERAEQGLRSALQRAAEVNGQRAARAERVQGLRQNVARDEREVQAQVAQATAIRNERIGLEQELRDLELRRASGDDDLQAVEARVAELEGLARGLELQVTGAEAAAAAAEEQLERHQGELDRLREQEAEAATGAERARGTLARLDVEAEAAAEHLGIGVEELERSEATPTDISGLDDESLQRRLTRALRDLRNVGNVDYGILAEHRAMEDRYTYLTEQLDDLTATEARIREGMEEARERLQEQFNRAFEDVNVRFKELFRELFRGGDAELLLSGEADRPQSGVDIVAQPPGKRLHRLATLSGGERALVGAALLLALISANPSPFCMLDEVDAALDEANVQRFVATVREMATRTQFILVTHNRATMEMADALFGVTMNPGAISQVLAIRLPD